MATQKFSELTTTSSPNSASVFAIAYSGTSYGVTLANVAANLPATTVSSLTCSGNATITGDLTVSGDDITMNTNTSGAALIADGTNFNPVVISGDIVIATGGAATIQADAVEGSMLNDNVISGQTEITSGLADADELLYSDAGTLKRVGMDTAKSYFHSTTSTAFTVADESSDTTCFPIFVTAATGDLAPKSAAGLTFNSSSDTLTATAFSGPLTGNVTGNASGSSGSCTGNSATTTALASARTIGGVSFDGTGNINLPGVNTAGNQNTSGTAAVATAVTITDNESTDEDNAIIFTSGGDVDGGNIGLESDGTCTYNPSTGKITATGFVGTLTGNVTGNTSGSSGSCTGNAATATALASARTIGGVSFDGTGNINLPGVNTAGNQDTSGTAAIATAVTITDNESTNEDNAVIFTSGGDVDGGNLGLESDGNCTYNPSTGSITATGFIGALTGNASGSSGSCTGLAATATALASARTIGGVSFDGTGNINLPGVNTAGNQNTSGTAAVATAVTITDNESTNEDNAIIFTSGGDVDGGNIGLESDGNCTYNPSTGSITATGFIGALTGNASGSSGSCTGNAATATVLETARTIGGVSFNGSANINLPGVNTSGNQNTSGSAASLSATLAVGSGGTGATSLTANGVLIGNGTSAIASVDMSTKGKILIGDGSGNPSLLTVGSNDQVLTADSGEATGVKWAAAGGGGGGGLVVESAVNFYGTGGSSVATYDYTGFDSDYDNYWVFIHGIAFDADGGNLDFRFLDDGSAVTGGGYRVSAVGIDGNGTARNITENNTTSASLTSLASNGSDAAPLTGWFYFANGRGGRWDSDSSDSEGAVKPYMDFHLGYKNSSNYHEVVTGSIHQDDTQANAMNGFQLIATSQNFRKICLTVYGVARA